MIRNLQIRSKLIAILVTPLIALTVLASLAIGANVARGVQADRVNDETAFALNLSQLVHELQRERDLSAGWVGSGRRAGYGGVVAQRVASNQALADFRRDVEGLSFEDDDSVLRQRVDTALAKLGKLNDERQRIEDNPTLTVAKTLDFYSGIINDLLAVDLEIATQTDDRDLIRNVSTFVALARFKEAVSLERGFLNAAASAGRFGQGEFQRLATIIGALIGGALLNRLGLYRSLMTFGVLQACSNLSFMVLAEVGRDYGVMVTAVAFENLSGGMGTTAMVALMMALCDHRYTATQFALFTSLAAVPRTFINAATGWLVENLGWFHFFGLCALLAVPGMLLLLKVAPWRAEDSSKLV